MNELKFIEAFNMIDDDLIKEAATENIVHDSSESIVDHDAERENIVVSGVETYHTNRWHKLAAVASVVLLIAGMGAGGSYLMKNRKNVAPDINDIEAETVYTTAITEVSEDAESTAKVTTSAKKKDGKTSGTEAAVNTVTTAVSGSGRASSARETDENGAVYNDGSPVNGSSVNNNRTTVAKTTTGKKTTTMTTTASPPEYLSISKLLDILQKGDNVTWDDLNYYIHEDLGSGTCYYNISHDVSLVASGGTSKKPGTLRLYKGYPSDLYIDARTDDIIAFVNDSPDYESVERNYKDIHPDAVSKVEVSTPNASTELTYDEINTLLTLIKSRDLLTRDNSYELSSMMRYDINIKYHGVGPNQQRQTDIGIIGRRYLILNGEGYICKDYQDDSLVMFLDAVVSRRPPDVIDVGGNEAFCWNDFFNGNFGDYRNVYESVQLTAFPDIVFEWNGMASVINVKRNGEIISGIGGSPLINAYFADINGDGYPELCCNSFVGSGIVDCRIEVYDIRNNARYTMADRGNYDFQLFPFDGELFVDKKENYLGDYVATGRLAIENGELVFKQI